MQTLQLLQHGEVVASRPGTDQASCCFPQVAVTPDGTWLVSYRASRIKDGAPCRVCLTRSSDGGATWSEPVTPLQAPAVNGVSGDFRLLGLTPLGGRDLLATLYWIEARPGRQIFNPDTNGLLDSKLFFARSDDAGLTWSTPQPVNVAPYDNRPTPATGPIRVLPDGAWGAFFELNNHWDDPSPWFHAACMTRSIDQGQTWEGAAPTAVDPELVVYYWDQRVNVMPDGALLACYWTYDQVNTRYLPMHAARSTDAGRTWSKPWSLGAPGQPAPPIALPDGRVLLVYVDREGPTAIRARLLTQGGQSLDPAEPITIFASEAVQKAPSQGDTRGTIAEMAHISIGLPDTAPLDDHRALVVWYAGAHADQTGIRWAVVGANSPTA